MSNKEYKLNDLLTRDGCEIFRLKSISRDGISGELECIYTRSPIYEKGDLETNILSRYDHIVPNIYPTLATSIEGIILNQLQAAHINKLTINDIELEFEKLSNQRHAEFLEQLNDGIGCTLQLDEQNKEILKKAFDVAEINNFEHVVGKTYLVRNQNGFNNALYAALGCAENDGSALYYTKKELRDAVQSWPEKYPAFVSFDDKMLECHRVFVTIDDFSSEEIYKLMMEWIAQK